MRRPIDGRLKQQHLGPLMIAVVTFAVAALWRGFSPSGFSAAYRWGELWVAGGIGVAPFLSWLGATEPDATARVDLFYSASTSSRSVFRDELQTAAARLPQLTVHFVDSSTQGRLTLAELEAYLGDQDQRAHVFLCGPRPMVDDLTRGLRASGLSGDHVHAEDFAFR